MSALFKKYFFNPAFLFWLAIFCIIPFIHSELIIDPDYIPKTFAFSCIIILFSLSFIFTKTSFRFFSRSIMLFWLLLGIYLITILFSILKSLNPGDAISDSIHLITPFLLLPCFLAVMEKDKNSIVWILRMQNIAIVIFSIYGGIQIFDGWQKATSQNIPFTVEYTLGSTLGNKNFFSETLLMILPFSLAGIRMDESSWKWLNFFVSVLIIFEIIFLKTISAITGLIAGFVIMIAVAALLSEKGKRIFSNWKGWSAAILVLGILFFSLTRLQVVQDSFQKARQITATFSKDAHEEIPVSDEVNRNSAYTRWFLWRNTFYLIKENPYTGIGMGNWKTSYAKYGVSGASYLNEGSSRFEHPHNEYLLMFCERGILALLLWLAIIATLFIYAFNTYRKIQNSSDRFLMLCMMGGIVFFSIISIFGYPLYRSYSPVMFVLIAAVILYYRMPVSTVAFQNKSLLLFTTVACAGIFVMFVLVKRFNGELNMAKALHEQSQQHFDRMNKFVTKADSYFFPLDLTTTPLNWYKGFSFFHSGQSDSAMVYFHKAELQSPYHIQVLNDLGACYENKGDHVKAIQYFDRVLVITPFYEETMLNKIVSTFNMGKIEEAYELLHARTYHWSEFFLSCRRAIVGAIAREVIRNSNKDEFDTSDSEKLASDPWISEVETRSKGSYITLKKELAEEFKKKS
jgi:O-antigen ligase